MGRKLDAILGRTFKPYKLKAVLNLAISRLAVLKNQRLVRSNHARSDVLQLLQLGHHDRALLRVEHVIKEQKMLDLYVMIEGYCNLLMERMHLIEQDRDRTCPEELKEAISGLLFASTRCGDFPELQEIRALFQSRYGKDFAARAIDLRNNCGVSPKMIQKLSTRPLDLEVRMKLLKEIASENNIILELHEQNEEPEMQPTVSNKTNENSSQVSESDGFSGSSRAGRKYRDVADAAQAAFESAAYAAEAARAAVQLSRSDSDNPGTPKDSPRKVSVITDHKNLSSSKLEPQPTTIDSKGKNVMVDDSSSSESGEHDWNPTTDIEDEEIMKKLEKDIVFDDGSDDDDERVPGLIQTGTTVGSSSGDEHSKFDDVKVGKGPIASVRTTRVGG